MKKIILSEQPIGKNILQTLRGNSAVLRSLDDLLQRGAFTSTRFLNSQSVLEAMIRGSLTAKENAFASIAIFKSITDKKILNEIAKKMVRDKEIRRIYGKLSDEQKKLRLKSNGFADEQIEAFMSEWKKSTLKYKTTRTKDAFIRSSKVSKDENKLYWKFLSNVARGKFIKPLSGFTRRERKLFSRWFLLGTTKSWKEIVIHFKRYGLPETLLFVGWPSFIRWIKLSTVFTILNAIWNGLLQGAIGIEDDKEYSKNEFIKMLEKLWENQQFADYRWIFPGWTIISFILNLMGFTKDRIVGKELKYSVENTKEKVKKEMDEIEDVGAKNYLKTQESKKWVKNNYDLPDNIIENITYKKVNDVEGYYYSTEEGHYPLAESRSKGIFYTNKNGDRVYLNTLKENNNMKRTIKEERDRIISLLGIREQEESIIKTTPLEKFKKIKFYDAKMKPIEFTADEENTVISKVEDVMTDGAYGDKSIVRAAVSVKGGKDEPTIKFGSFATDSEIIDRETIYDDDGDFMNDGDNIRDYFEIVMTGPDIDDYKIVRVRAQDLEEEPEKEDMVEPEVEQPEQPVKEEPFEQVMKEKERKGFSSLLSQGEITNEFTKNQKRVLEKLKGSGYLFKEPEATEGYKRMKVKSGEFNEEFTVWKKK